MIVLIPVTYSFECTRNIYMNCAAQQLCLYIVMASCCQWKLTFCFNVAQETESLTLLHLGFSDVSIFNQSITELLQNW